MLPFRPAPQAAALLLAGCASLPRERGYAETSALLIARVGTAPDPAAWTTPAPPEVPAEPITAERAIALAFVHNPRIRETYARLGLGRAELEEARRLANPSFGFARLAPRGGGSPRITRSLSFGFADLLLLPARKRFAQAELDRLQNEVAAQLLQLSVDVEAAWFEAVGARQVADMRGLVAGAAETSAELAQRFFDAGNITRLQLEQEKAAAVQARIGATRALAQALKSRGELAGAMGLPAAADWTLEDRLPAPPATVVDASSLMPRALEQRLDLAAAPGRGAARRRAQHREALALARQRGGRLRTGTRRRRRRLPGADAFAGIADLRPGPGGHRKGRCGTDPGARAARCDDARGALALVPRRWGLFRQPLTAL